MDQLKKLIGHKVTIGALGTLGLNIANQLFLFGILVLLARIMSPEDFGLYSVILSLMVLLALPFTGGFSTFVIRHISKYNAQNDQSHIRGVLNFSFLWVFIGIILMMNAFYHIASFIWPENYNLYRLGGVVLFGSSVLLLMGAIARGFKRVVLGRFFEFFLQPLFLILLFSYVFLAEEKIDTEQAIIFHSISLVLAIILFIPSLIIILRKINYKEKAKFQNKEWIKSAVPFILAVGLVIANMHIDIVMVGALAGDEEAGFYRVASRMAAFVPFFLFAVNNALAPRISGLYTQGKIEELQKILTIASRIIFIATIPVAIILCVFSESLLGILFGEEYKVAAMALIILAFANLFSVMMGQVGQVMALTGHEVLTAWSVFIAVIVNVILNYIFVPVMGLEGAAVATASSIVIWNMLLAFWTEKKTGLRCTALSSLKSNPS